jgi:hypothetical protein
MKVLQLNWGFSWSTGLLVGSGIGQKGSQKAIVQHFFCFSKKPDEPLNIDLEVRKKMLDKIN